MRIIIYRSCNTLTLTLATWRFTPCSSMVVWYWLASSAVTKSCKIAVLEGFSKTTWLISSSAIPIAILTAIVSSAKKICCSKYPIKSCQDLEFSLVIILLSTFNYPRWGSSNPKNYTKICGFSTTSGSNNTICWFWIYV